MACSWSPIKLGKTTLEVAPLGIASSYGIQGPSVERAFERGINLLYWGSARTKSFGSAIKNIGARSREKMVVVIQSYARSPSSIEKSLDKALKQLSLDHADILLLGWWNMPPKNEILDAAAELIHRKKARALMLSCHHRPTFLHYAKDSRIDLLMMRYNAAHPGAEHDVFPHLPEARPGIIAYTSTSWGQLLNPSFTPAGECTPSSADCYRFVLSNPCIDACYAGPKNDTELDQAMRALDLGPMNAEELAWMKRVGSSVHEKAKTRAGFMNLGDKLINWISGFGFRKTTDLPSS